MPYVKRDRILSVGALLAAGVLAAVPARAQSGGAASEPPVVDAPVVLDVAPGAAPVAPAALRDAVSRELGAPVVAPGAASGTAPRGTLRIVSDAEHHLVLSFRDASGREVWRVVSVPRDPTAALATIAFLAGNLARDEASEITAELQPRRAPAAPVEAAPAPPAPVPAAPPEPEAPPPAPAPEAAEPEPVVLEPVPVLATDPLDDRAPPRTAPRDRHATRLGFYAAGGIATSGLGSGIGFSTGVNYAFGRHLALDFTLGGGFLDRDGPVGADFGHIHGTHLYTGPMIVARLPARAFRFEGAAGIVAIYNDGYAIGFSYPVYSTASSLGLGAQGRIGVHLALGANLDVFAEGLASISSSGYIGPLGEYSTWWFASAQLGIQARFL